jgi:hypothetical protein
MGPYHMLRGWYYNKNNGQRLLHIEEIAEACCCTARKAEKWFADKLQRSAHSSTVSVDASEVVAFLVRNSMPVPSTVLPPNTRKILFISADNYTLQNEERRIACILDFFKEKGNLLVENSSAGQFADLTILTFNPNIVVYFLGTHDQTSRATLALLSNFPDLSLLLLVDKATLPDLEDKEILSPKNVIISDELSEQQCIVLLRSTYSQT